MSIVTLTMNPAIDIATATAQVRPTDKLRCAAPRFDPGGGGINVARTIAMLGEPVTAVFPVGGPEGVLLEQLVRDAGVPMHTVPVEASTRQSFAVTDESADAQYRFVFPGPRLTAPEAHRCLAAVERAVSDARLVVASGSLPPGVSVDFYQRLADLLADLDVPLVLDTSGEPLRSVRKGVYLLKPSVRELADYTGHPLRDRAAQLTAARGLVTAGVTQVVVLSLGEEGALLVTRDGEQWFEPMDVTVRSGIGAGDAMVAGIGVGVLREYSLADAVHLGITAATAALGTPGTRPGHPARVAELLHTVMPERSAITL